MNVNDLTITIYADGADIEGMKEEYSKGIVKGFTTNPTLMKKAGVKDYVTFAKECVKEIPDLPLSLEVFADDFPGMEEEARMIDVEWNNSKLDTHYSVDVSIFANDREGLVSDVINIVNASEARMILSRSRSQIQRESRVFR